MIDAVTLARALTFAEMAKKVVDAIKAGATAFKELGKFDKGTETKGPESDGVMVQFQAALRTLIDELIAFVPPQTQQLGLAVELRGPVFLLGQPLFSDLGRKEIGQKMLEFLKGKLDEKGIIVQDVLLRDVRLPTTFSASIENKLKAEQESFQKEFELKKAQKDAEIEVARAKGIAQSNEIISASLNDSYLRYLWIQGLQKNDAQIIYVPTEGNIPIMEASRFSGKTQ